MALGWLGTGGLAYVAVRRGEIAAHRRWMIGAHALRPAEVTLRIHFGLRQSLAMLFATSYSCIAWLRRVSDLVVVE